ncbi:unnamed protein product [Fraxinus pennsylvanica]|uniref:Uncharacterized protein n=1 Tax=Fraxinus pennsylvanica TaxID=56036 RepID=A0AAD2A447_9LAMI|nr:unnamed protein product [Fraxinus pennsylvanica]
MKLWHLFTIDDDQIILRAGKIGSQGDQHANAEANIQQLAKTKLSCSHSCGSGGLKTESLNLNEAGSKTGKEIFEDESTMLQSLLEFTACIVREQKVKKDASRSRSIRPTDLPAHSMVCKTMAFLIPNTPKRDVQVNLMSTCSITNSHHQENCQGVRKTAQDNHTSANNSRRSIKPSIGETRKKPGEENLLLNTCSSSSPGRLVLEYFGTRKAMVLQTIESCDLLPASWISVAWYPIYRIPVGLMLGDLDASFLTFHSIAMQAVNSSKDCSIVDSSSKISLPVFDLASFKLRDSVLSPREPHECEQEGFALASC